MTTVNMDEPLPAIQIPVGARVHGCHLLVRDEFGFTRGMSPRDLVQALAALTRQQLHDVCVALSGDKDFPPQHLIWLVNAGLAFVPSTLWNQEKARADQAEQALRSVAKDWRDGLAARKNGDTLAVELVQRVARMAEGMESKNG